MKKKGLLGILAVLMVFALALTGCGQQGEQNAGATGSEGQNGTAAADDGKNEGEVTTEPENAGGAPDAENGTDNHNPEIRDGYYVYEVLGEEFLCKTNVWDYIDEDAKTINIIAMKDDLGFGTNDEKYFVGNLQLRAPSIVAGSVSEIGYEIVAFTDDTHSKVDFENWLHYTIKYGSAINGEYVSSRDNRYGFTLDLIILTAYGSEHLKDSITDLPLGDHLQEYYNAQTLTYELP